MAQLDWNAAAKASCPPPQPASPHDMKLAHMFSAQAGSSSIGAFLGSPGMQPPPSSRHFYPVYQDSSLFCCGSSYPPGYAGLDAGLNFKNYIKGTSSVKTSDCLKSWFNQALASNPIGTFGSLFQAAGSFASGIAGLAGGLSGWLGGFGKSAT